MNTNALSILTMIKSVNWDAIAAISGSVAAIMAAGQLWQSRIDSNRRLAISLLRDFTIIHEKLNQYDLAETMESVLRSYRQKVPLTGPGADYISFLHSLEFIAHSYFAGGIDKKIVDRFS